MCESHFSLQYLGGNSLADGLLGYISRSRVEVAPLPTLTCITAVVVDGNANYRIQNTNSLRR